MEMKNDCDQMSHNAISKNRQNVSDKNFYSFFLTVPSLSTIRKVTFLLNLKNFKLQRRILFSDWYFISMLVLRFGRKKSLDL